MPPVVIAAGVMAAGAVTAGVIASEGQADANEANAEIAANATATNISEAQKNRDFQERMSNTSYQRGVEDMRKAGINPILAADRGGASTPSGSAAQAVTATMQNEGEGLAGGISSAAGVVMPAMSLASQINLQSAQAKAAASQSALNIANSYKALADAGYTRQSARIAKVNADIEEAMLSTRISEWGKGVRSLGDFTGAVGNIFHGSSSSHTSGGGDD